MPKCAYSSCQNEATVARYLTGVGPLPWCTALICKSCRYKWDTPSSSYTTVTDEMLAKLVMNELTGGST